MSFSYTASSPPFAKTFPGVGVFRYTPFSGTGTLYTLLPNVECLTVEELEGPHPSVAQFRYRFGDPLADPSDPARIEDVYPLAATGPNVVEAGDRLVVRLYSSRGAWSVIFDGYALIPQVEADERRELASFEALGVPVREWDHPVGGALMRDGDAPKTVSDVPTEIRTRFNPDKEPNRTPDGTGVEVNDGRDNQYPTFLDWRLKQDPDLRKPWTLSDAVRYLLFYCKVTNFEDPAKAPDLNVKVPTSDELKALLDSRRPKPDPDGVIDPNDPSTFEDDPIDLSDIDITGEVWPEALEKLIAPHGFGFMFRLSTNNAGDPDWKLDIYRRDTPVPVKTPFMQKAGPSIVYDPGKGPVHEVRLQRDVRNVVNAFVIDTALRRYEVSVILAPGFKIAAGDESLDRWIKSTKGYDPIGYRVWIYDETGDGHWDIQGDEWVDPGTATLWDIFGKAVKGVLPYCKRRRPGASKLLTTDKDDDPLRSEIRISTDYTGVAPGLWDGKSGTWQRVTTGSWSLLDDRLGIELTMPDPRRWNIGEDLVTSNAPFPDGKLDVVTCLAAPDGTVTKQFYIMLTTVVEGDKGLAVQAKRRTASPVPQQVTRRIDGGDRWLRETVNANSWNAAPGGADEDTRDDTDDAKAFAASYRKAHELGAVAGTLVYRRLTNVLRIGDRVDTIAGRDLDLTENAGSGTGEGATYPCVVGRTWVVGGEGAPATILPLSDRRADPEAERRRATRKIKGA